jgi:catechol 2,3-dioxygenase-like lactoylglutathione lyase family enzyme
MTQLVKNRIGGIFVPVRDVAKAREWYLGLLGLPRDDEPLDSQHLYVIPMEDPKIVLDEMPEWGGDQPDGPPTYQTPAFMLDTDDVHAAHTYVRDYGADMVTDTMNLTASAGSSSAISTATTSWSAAPTRRTATHQSKASPDDEPYDAGQAVAVEERDWPHTRQGKQVPDVGVALVEQSSNRRHEWWRLGRFL